MKLEYFEPNDLDIATVDDLWAQNINMDDWDFMLVTHEIDKFEQVTHEDGTKEWAPTAYYHLSYLLNTNFNYTSLWYQVKWKGKKAMMGITYHS